MRRYRQLLHWCPLAGAIALAVVLVLSFPPFYALSFRPTTADDPWELAGVHCGNLFWARGIYAVATRMGEGEPWPWRYRVSADAIDINLPLWPLAIGLGLVSALRLRVWLSRIPTASPRRAASRALISACLAFAFSTALVLSLTQSIGLRALVLTDHRWMEFGIDRTLLFITHEARDLPIAPSSRSIYRPRLGVRHPWPRRWEAAIPVWPLPLLSLVLCIHHARRYSRSARPRACKACGYPLTGLPTAICPECGLNHSSRYVYPSSPLS